MDWEKSMFVTAARGGMVARATFRSSAFPVQQPQLSTRTWAAVHGCERPLLPRRDAIKRRLASALRSLYVLVAPASNQFFETSHYG